MRARMASFAPVSEGMTTAARGPLMPKAHVGTK